MRAWTFPAAFKRNSQNPFAISDKELLTSPNMKKSLPFILGLYVFLLVSRVCVAQTPHIIKLTPSIAKVGATQQQVVIVGASFPADSTVLFNGATVPSPKVTETSIDVTLPAADLATAGEFPMAVNSQTKGASNEVKFTVSDTGVRGVSLVLGIGTLLVGNSTNYKINSTANVLEGAVIGKAAPQLMAGVDFRLPIPGFSAGAHHSRADPWNAFVSLTFAPNSTQTLTGLIFGLDYRVSSHLSILGGFALTPFNEPSPGFRNAAIAAVTATPGAYPGFTPSARRERSECV